MLFKGKANLDEVSIAAPCPVDWAQMEGNNRIRFCSLCELNVYNISEMSKREAEALLKDHSGQLCLRLYRRLDGTVITKNCPVGRRMIDAAKKRARAITAMFIAMLNAPAVFGQQQKGSEEPAKVNRNGDMNMFQVETSLISGRPASGRDFRKEATPRSVPDGVKSNADTTALDAFRAARSYEDANEVDKAIVSYEKAIATFRNPQGNYDRKFANMVAKKYADLLRSQNKIQDAVSIEREFCDGK